MSAKRTDVVLEVEGREQSFPFSVAERILRMKRNGGWHLPANSKWEFVDHALQRRTVKKSD
jgi:hypothetical protein